MCGGCYIPPFLIPIIYLIDLPRRLKELAKGVDNKIRNNNQKIVSQVQSLRFEHSKCNEKEIEINNALENTNDVKERRSLIFKRAIVQIEAERFDNALEDLMSIKEASEDNHIFHYVLGKALEGKGEYKEAANSMLKAIEKIQLLNEEECLELENELVQTQLDTKHTIEKGLIKAFGALDKLKSKVRKEEKPKTSVNLELLYMNAGVCYNFAAYYEDAIKMFTKAIELGEGYSSSYVVLNYYNRGLCYYYSHGLDDAERDFTKVIEMNHLKIVHEKEEPYKMRALVYGRKGLLKNMKDDNSKAKLINPFTKFVSVFHHRLLDEDTTNTIFSFLELKDLLVVGSTGKYWRGLVGKIISTNTIHLSMLRIMPNVEELKNRKSLLHSIFLPKNEYLSDISFFSWAVLHHTILCNYSKSVIVYTPCDEWGGSEMLLNILMNFRGVEKLKCNQYFGFDRNNITAWTYFAKHSKLTNLTFYVKDQNIYFSEWKEDADIIVALFKDSLEYLSVSEYFLSTVEKYYDQFTKLKTVEVIIDDVGTIESTILKYSVEYPTITFNAVESKYYADIDGAAMINHETDI